VTEAEWLESAKPEWMLLFARRHGTDRQLRLFACACCRRMWSLLGERDRRGVELAEQLAGGAASPGAVEDFRRGTDWSRPGPAKYALDPDAYGAASSVLWHSLRQTAEAAASAAMKRALSEEGETREEAFRAGQRAYERVGARAARDEATAHARLIRCAFGNPFRPVRFEPAWRTDTAVALARHAHDAGDESVLPILADALQDAGCDDADILGHCRGEGPHARCCRVVDAVLGRT
jgi:hypothetical protein